MLYMVTFTINIPPMLAYIPYMCPMVRGTCVSSRHDMYPKHESTSNKMIKIQNILPTKHHNYVDDHEHDRHIVINMSLK